jgi:hypothetical protein
MQTRSLTLDAQTFDFSVHDAMVTIHNPATGNVRTFRIITQPLDARFAPGERLAELFTGNPGREWQTFGFVSPRGIAVWNRLQSTQMTTFGRMLTNPGRYTAKGFEYTIEPIGDD